jgi:hypothetical protein
LLRNACERAGGLVTCGTLSLLKCLFLVG